MSSGRILYRRIIKVSTVLSTGPTAASNTTGPPEDAGSTAQR